MRSTGQSSNHSAVRVLSAVPGNFASIAALDRSAWEENPCSEFIPDGAHVWRIWCEHALTFVAMAEAQKVTGAVVAFPCLNGCFCVQKVMVEKSHRGKGIGSHLFEALFESLDRREAECFLTVDPANSNAVWLYRKWGFSHERFVPRFYRLNEDRLVLTRRSQASTL